MLVTTAPKVSGSPYAPTYAPFDSSPANGDTNPDAAGPDLTIFLIAHRVFRQEFARLAVAAAGVCETDTVRVAAIEKQIAMMAHSLHAHHHDEDTTIWPLLRERDPAAAVVLDVLEAEHEQIDPLIQQITDRSVSLRRRSGALDELSTLINRHLDREEADAVPMLRRHIPFAEWEAMGKQRTKEVRAELPMFVWTMTEHMSEAEVAQLLATGPKLLVLLYKLAWRRKGIKRSALVYGA